MEATGRVPSRQSLHWFGVDSCEGYKYLQRVLSNSCAWVAFEHLGFALHERSASSGAPRTQSESTAPENRRRGGPWLWSWLPEKKMETRPGLGRIWQGKRLGARASPYALGHCQRGTRTPTSCQLFLPWFQKHHRVPSAQRSGEPYIARLWDIRGGGVEGYGRDGQGNP